MSTLLSLSIYWTSVVVVFLAASVLIRKLEAKKANKAAVRVVINDNKHLNLKIKRKG